MLRAAIAKTLCAGLYSADAKGFVSMRFKGVAGDMRMIKLHARKLRQMAKAGAVSLIAELLRYTLHWLSPRGSSLHYQE